MKRKLIIAVSFVVLSWVGSSCEDLKTCKNCKQVVYIDNVFDHEGSTSQYCDAQLIVIENMDPVIIDNQKTVWECN